MAGVEPLRSPVVEDQKIGFDELAEDTGEATVPVGEFEFIEEPGQALVDDGGVIPAGFLPEGAGEPGFAEAAGAGDH